MKSAVLLTAMLSGLCAEAMAAPIDIPSSQSALADSDDVLTHTSVIERDLDFHAASAPESLFEDDDEEEDTAPWDLNLEAAVSDEEFAIGGNGSGFLTVSGPPLLTTIGAGLSCLGIIVLCRRRTTRKRRSKRRRRVVQMRAIIAAER
jgi:hypothetical protein